MKQKLLHPTNKSARSESLWLAAVPLLAALLAISIALYRSPARPVSGETPLTIQSSAPGPVIDPVVHNIGKYVASHQILWPELSRPKSTQLSIPPDNKPLRRHR